MIRPSYCVMRDSSSGSAAVGSCPSEELRPGTVLALRQVCTTVAPLDCTPSNVQNIVQSNFLVPISFGTAPKCS